jgi:hypothetical protein
MPYRGILNAQINGKVKVNQAHGTRHTAHGTHYTLPLINRVKPLWGLALLRNGLTARSRGLRVKYLIGNNQPFHQYTSQPDKLNSGVGSFMSYWSGFNSDCGRFMSDVKTSDSDFGKSDSKWGRCGMGTSTERRCREGSPLDAVAPPNGGAVNPSYRQTDDRTYAAVIKAMKFCASSYFAIIESCRDGAKLQGQKSTRLFRDEKSIFDQI